MLKGDEAIAALAQDVQQFPNVVGFQVAGMKQENLLRLIADGFDRELLGESKRCVVISEIVFHQIALQGCVVALLGVFVDSGKHPVPTIERHGSDAISAIDEKRFCLATS